MFAMNIHELEADCAFAYLSLIKNMIYSLVQQHITSSGTQEEMWFIFLATAAAMFLGMNIARTEYLWQKSQLHITNYIFQEICDSRGQAV